MTLGMRWHTVEMTGATADIAVQPYAAAELASEIGRACAREWEIPRAWICISACGRPVLVATQVMIWPPNMPSSFRLTISLNHWLCIFARTNEGFTGAA
jgi:hypothetical protein